MEPLSADEIRRSFVNSSKSQVKAMTLPPGFTELPWESLDYLGWRDPKAPNRGYLVVRREAAVTGIAVNTQASALAAVPVARRASQGKDRTRRNASQLPS